MNTNNFYLSALMGICCLTACSIHEMDIDQPLARPPREGEALTFYADIEENDPNTRTTAVVMENGVTVQHWWNPGDSLNIFYGNMLDQSGSKFKATTQEVSQTTNFTGTLGAFVGVAEGGSSQTHYFWATYPYSEDNRSDGNSVLMTMPAQQEIPIDSWDPASDLYVARSRGLNLYFYLVGTGVRFTVSQPGIARIDFRANGDNAPALAGTVRVAFGDDNKPYVTEVVSDASPVVRVTPKDGACFVPGQYYYVHFLPGTLVDGLSVTYYDLDGIPAKYPINSSLQLQRKEIHTLDGKDADLVFAVPNDQIWYKTTDGQALDIAEYTSVPGESDWFILTHSTQPGDFLDVESALFQDQPRLQNVSLPRSVTSVYEDAFADCSALETIVLPAYNDPSNSFGISNGAFIGCTSLRSVEFPEIWSFDENVSGDDVFAGCTALSVVSGGHTSSDCHAIVFNGTMVYFAGAGIESYTIPNEITAIGDDVFNGNTTLKSLVIPEGITSIGKQALMGMTNPEFTELNLPASLEEIGESAFKGSKLKEINIAATTPPTLLGDGWQFDNLNINYTINVPYGTLEDYMEAPIWGVYAGHIQTRYYVIEYSTNQGVPIQPTKTTGYGDGVNLVSFGEYGKWRFDKPVTAIPNGAFQNMSTLKTVTIPETVVSIGTDPFHNCPELTTFIGKYAMDEGRSLVTDDGKLVSVAPCGLNSYSVPEGVTTIGEGAFRGSPIASVDLPSTLTTIEPYAFESSAVEDLTIPENVTSIGILSLAATNLLCVHFLSPNPLDTYLFNGRTYFGNGLPRCIIIVPDDSLTNYKNTWTRFAEEKMVPESGVIYYQTSDHEAVGVSPAEDDFAMSNIILRKTGYNTAKDYGIIAYDQPLTWLSDWLFYPTGDYDPSNIISVTIPSKVFALGTGLANLTGLTSLTIPESVTSIPANAFRGCTNLTKFEGSHASADGRCLIYNNKVVAFLPNGLTHYTFPEGVEEVNCNILGHSLTSITFPDGVKKIGGVFGSSTTLTSIRFPESLTHIGYSSFSWNKALKNVTIPGNVVQIGMDAFWGCSALEDITFQGTTPPELMNNHSLDGDDTGIGESKCDILVPSYPSTVRDDYVAAWSGKVTSTRIKDCVCEFSVSFSWGDPMSTYAVMNARKDPCVKSVESVGNSTVVVKLNTRITEFFRVEAIINPAFLDDYQISGFTLPDEITEFRGNAFRHFPNLTRVTSKYSPTGEYIVTDDGVLRAIIPHEGFFSFVVPDCVTAIGPEVFANQVNLQSITFHDNITSIGNRAFDGTLLTDQHIDLPENLQTIGDLAFRCWAKEFTYGIHLDSIGENAFYNNPHLESVTFRNPHTPSQYAGLQEIGKEAFAFCTNLRTFTHPGFLNKIEEAAFAGCSSLQSINLSRARQIGDNAFNSCHGLTELNFSWRLQSIGESAFVGTSITSLVLPEGVKTVGKRAFKGNSALEYVLIPASVRTFGDEAFLNCTSLSQIVFEGRPSDVDYGAYMFKNCTSLRQVTLPSLMRSMHGMFYGCSSLQTVVIPGPHTYTPSSSKNFHIVGDDFAYCTSLTTIDIPSNVKTIGRGTFEGCTNLRHINIYGEAPHLWYGGGLYSLKNYQIHVNSYDDTPTTYTWDNGWNEVWDHIVFDL